MVNSGSYDSDADRNAKGEAQSASSVLASCEEDFATQTADGLLPPHAIEPTASKTDYTCNMSELLLRARKILQEAPVQEGSSTGKADVLEARLDIPKDEKKIKVCCSVPLEKVQDILKVCRTPPKKQISKKELCLYCDRTFATSGLKQKHVERFHSVKYNRRLSTRRQVKPSVTACMFCEQLNNTECTLKQLFNHLVTSHSKKYFGCLDCETRFPTSQSLKNHVLKIHADTKELIQNLIAEKRNRIQLNTVEPLTPVDSDQKFNQTPSVGSINKPTMCSDSKLKSTPCSKPNTGPTQKSSTTQKSSSNQKPNTGSIQKPPKSITPITKSTLSEPDRVEKKDNNAANSVEKPVSEEKETARDILKIKTKPKKKKIEKETKTNVEEETKKDITVNPELVKTADKASQKESKPKSWIKELRSKKVGVISTKMGIKQGFRITRQQAKLLETNKNKKKIKAPKNEKNDKTTVSTKYLSYQNHHPYTFDFSFRIKKITDHSIDNIKISSLTFDDVFDKAFFNRVKCNIQENLQNHIDGKLFKSVESENRISSFQKSNGLDEVNQNIGCKISTNAITPVAASLLGDNFGEDIESQIEYGSKAKKKASVVNDEVHYKYFTRRKYQAVISQNKQHRDLSKLDMWTQLVVKNRQQKILSDQKTDKERLEYKKSDEYKMKMQIEELDKILEKRGPLEDLKEEAIKTVALEKLNGPSDTAMTSIDTYFDVTMILNELLNNLFTSTTPASLSTPIEVQGSTSTSEVSLDGEEIPAMLNLQRVSYSDSFTQKTELEKAVFLELTGEWARTRIYVCAACGLKMPNAKSLMDHKNLYHEHVWCQHYEFVGNQGELYRHLNIPSLGKVGEIENSGSKILKRSDARVCSKCNKQFNCLGDLHRHVLECGGDWTWMLARKKYKYRSYGSKARKRRRGLLKFLHAFRERKQQSREKAKTIKKFEGPRPKPSDADSIQRMLANLPPKRTTRKIICLKDGFQRKVKNKNVTKTNKKLSHKKMQAKRASQKNVSAQNVKTKRSLRMLRSNSGHVFENKLVLPKLKKESKDAHAIRRHSVRNISRAVSNSLVKSSSKAKRNDTHNKEKEAVKDKSVPDIVSKSDRTSRRIPKEITSTDTKSEVEEDENLKIPKKPIKSEEKKIGEVPFTAISSKKSKKTRIVNDITESNVIPENKPKIIVKKIPAIKKKLKKQKLVADQTKNILLNSNKKVMRLPNGRFMKKGMLNHVDPGMPHLEPEVLIDKIEDCSQNLNTKIPRHHLTPETIPAEPPLLDPLPKICKVKNKKSNIPINPDTASYVPKASDKNSKKLTLRLKKTKPCIKINLRTSCRKNAKSKEALKNAKAVKKKIKKSIIKLIQVDGSSQNKPSTRSTTKTDFLGVETTEENTEEPSLEKGEVNDEAGEKTNKEEDLPIKSIDTSDTINDSILESNNEAPKEVVAQSEIQEPNNEVSLITVKTEVVETEEMKNEKEAKTAPLISISKLPPVKKKKKQRGLNDCIAMLTNKLQDKSFSQQPFQSSIFGSVIDKPPNGFPLVQFNVFSKREEISETKFQTNSKPLGSVSMFDLNGDKMKNKENVELSTKPTYSSILAKPRFISNFYESTTTPCFWKENKTSSANSSPILQSDNKNDKEKEESMAATPVINTEENAAAHNRDDECSIKPSECEVRLTESENKIQNETENCNENRDGPNESILKIIEEETLKLNAQTLQEKENIDREDKSYLNNMCNTSLVDEIIESQKEDEKIIDQPEDLSKSRNVLSPVKLESKKGFPILKISVSKTTRRKKKKEKTKKTSPKKHLKKNFADVLMLINDVIPELTDIEEQPCENDNVVGDNHQVVDMDLIEDCIHTEINENVVLEKESQNVEIKEVEESSNHNENLTVLAEDFTSNAGETQEKSADDEFIDSEDDIPLVKLIDKSRSEGKNEDEESCTETQKMNEENSSENVTDDVLNKTDINLESTVMPPEINEIEHAVIEKETEPKDEEQFQDLTIQDDVVKEASSNNTENLKATTKNKKRGKKKNENKSIYKSIENHEENELPVLEYVKDTFITEDIDNQNEFSINTTANLTASEIYDFVDDLAKEVPENLKNILTEDIVENEDVSRSDESVRPRNEVQRQSSFSSENDLQLDAIALDLEQAEKVLDQVLDNAEKDTENEDTLNEELYVEKPDAIPKESEMNEPLTIENQLHNETCKSKTKRIKNPPKSKKIVPKKISKNAAALEDVFCEICNKVFSRSENLLKHRRTLTHIAKLSEIEAAQAAERAKREEPKKPVEQIIEDKNEVLLNNEVSISYEYPKSDISSFSFASRQGSLKLVDIISDVLSKPITNDFPKSNFADLILPSEHEVKRCKSLGERKSFESDKLFFGATSPASNIDLDQKFSKLSNTANVIVEKQLSILENMIEDNRMNFSGSERMFDSSELPPSEEYSNQSSSSEFSLLSSNKPEECNEITFSHNTDIISNLIKPTLDEENVIQPTQYEEISDDSSSSHFQVEEQKSRKVLNRDEELFLECCSLLKSSSDVSDLCKKPKSAQFLNNFGLKPLDESSEWLEHKQLAPKKTSNLQYVANSFISDDSHMNTSVGDNFYDYSNSNSNINLKGILERTKNDHVFSQPPIFEDISNGSEDSSRKSELKLDPVPKVSNETEFNKLKIDTQLSPNVESAQIPKEQEVEELIEIEENNEKITPDSKSDKYAEDSQGGKLPNTQASITDYTISKKAKKNDNKKMLTKGAMKVFEGLKVSIPKNGLDMKEVFSCSPTSKRLQLEAEEEKEKKVEKDPLKHNFHFNKIINTEGIKKIGNKLGLKITKRKFGTNLKNNKEKEQGGDKKAHDVYDFEETQDNIDTFAVNSTSLTNYRTFRNKFADKSEILFRKDGENIDECKKDEDKKGDIIEEEKINDKEKEMYPSEDSVMTTLKKLDTCTSITKNKCMIMGRIFKNAVKPKLTDDIKSLPVMENSKMVESFVLDCQKHHSNLENNKKLSEEEMNILFDNLLNDEKSSSKKKENPEATETINHAKKDKTENPVANKLAKATDNRKKSKTKKRPRTNSTDSSDEEFSMKKIPKRHYKKTKNTEHVINLEQELKECIGVASRKSQRKCTSGKQNVLVEYWSSDESNSDIEEFETKAPSPEPPPPPPEPPQVVELPPEIEEVEQEEREELVVEEKELKKTSKPKQLKKKQLSELDEESKQSIASTRKKRSAVDTLYYWSSSSEDELQDIIEVKPLREVFDDEDRPLQHGWIVGDSPKKLVTMLAQAKGKKLESDCVKKNKKKRTSV